MAKKKLVSHAARLAREAVAENLSAEVAAKYRGMSTSAAYERIRRSTGLSLCTLQRAASGGTSPQLDTLADLAHHLGTSVEDLVTQHQVPLGKSRTAT